MIFEMVDCGGCKTCELACSYHHSGLFNPTLSSLRILSRLDNKPGYIIEILLPKEDVSGCDSCEGLEQPMCVQYCHQEADLLRMIESLNKGTNYHG